MKENGMQLIFRTTLTIIVRYLPRPKVLVQIAITLSFVGAVLLNSLYTTKEVLISTGRYYDRISPSLIAAAVSNNDNTRSVTSRDAPVIEEIVRRHAVVPSSNRMQVVVVPTTTNRTTINESLTMDTTLSSSMMDKNEMAIQKSMRILSEKKNAKENLTSQGPAADDDKRNSYQDPLALIEEDLIIVKRNVSSEETKERNGVTKREGGPKNPSSTPPPPRIRWSITHYTHRISNKPVVSKKHPKPTKTSPLFPSPVNLIRSGIRIDQFLVYPDHRFESNNNDEVDADADHHANNKCSCRNPTSQIQCCARHFRTAYQLDLDVPEYFYKLQQRHGRRAGEHPYEYNYLDRIPAHDYRDVLIMGDLYKMLIDGYLMHFADIECRRGIWKNIPFLMYLEYPLDDMQYWTPQVNDNGQITQTLCDYISSSSTEAGMLAYIEFAFRTQYQVWLSQWAMAQQIQEVKERTLIVCQQDLVNDPDMKTATIQMMLDFVYNGTMHKDYYRHSPKIRDSSITFGFSILRFLGYPKPEQAYEKDYVASMYPLVTLKLRHVIEELDNKYFDRDIKWLASILPCT